MAARPDDFLSLAQLASVQAEQARLTVDLDGYQRALSDVEQSLAIVPAYPPTIRVRGSLRFTLHDFAGAFADAKTVLTALPDDATALALLGRRLELELGRPADAVVAYARLAAASPGPWLDIRRARLASVDRGPDRSACPRPTRELPRRPAMDPAEQGFYEYALGEYARLAGDAATARPGFEAALQIRVHRRRRARRPRSDRRVRWAHQRRDRRASRPLPRSLLSRRRWRCSATCGRPAAISRGGDAQFKTVRFIERLGAIQGAVYDRQLLRFELDHGGASTDVLAAAQASLAGATRLLRARHGRLGALPARPVRRGRRRDRTAAAATAPTTRGCGSTTARSPRPRRPARPANAPEAALALGPALDPIERAEAQRLLGVLDLRADAVDTPPGSRDAAGIVLVHLHSTNVHRPCAQAAAPSDARTALAPRRRGTAGHERLRRSSSGPAACTTSWVRRRTRSPNSSA